MNSAIFLEIKTEYTEHLKDILTPFIYEGLKTIYDDAKTMSSQTQQSDKVILIFQKILQNVPKWNPELISNETIRIKTKSGTAEYFDDLVKAVIKSNIILLTFGNSISNAIAQGFYDGLKIDNFIHRCYIECAKEAFNSAYLFFDDNIEPVEYKRNQKIIKDLIDSALDRAIRKMLPIKSILNEFLINSMPLLQENHPLPKVELVATVAQANPNATNPLNQMNPMNPGQLPTTANPINLPAQPVIEKMEIGNPLGQLGEFGTAGSSLPKMEKDRVKELIGLDKIISQTMPDILSPGSRNALTPHVRANPTYSQNGNGVSQNNSNNQGKTLEIKINPMMLMTSEKNGGRKEGFEFDDESTKTSGSIKKQSRDKTETATEFKSNDFVEVYDNKGASSRREPDPNKKFFRKN